MKSRFRAEKLIGVQRPGLGSPFQINFPQPPTMYNHTDDALIVPLNPTSLSCASEDPSIACACADCPARCLSLPALPDTSSHCHVGALTCGSFFLVISYSALLLSFTLGTVIKDFWQKRHIFFANKGGRLQLPVSPAEYDHVDLSNPLAPENEENGGVVSKNLAGDGQNGRRWQSAIRSLIGAKSTSQTYDGDSVTRSSSSTRKKSHSGASSANLLDSDSNNTLSRHHLGRGASLLSPDLLAGHSQPRTYRLNVVLSSLFYRVGLTCASSPWITIAIGLMVCGVINTGWIKFTVEMDPVKLWVARNSELAVQKNHFETNFGPFYRTEQIFLSSLTAKDSPVLSWDVVKWWSTVEEEVRNLVSPAGSSLRDICFAPTATFPENVQVWDCTVQSFMGYFHDSLNGLSADNWSERLDTCASSPSACLSSAGQPLNPRLLFGGIPGYSGDKGRLNDVVAGSTATAVVITYVVSNTLDAAKLQKIEEWEHALKDFLQGVEIYARDMHSIILSYSTGVSLEEELNKSTNTDIPIVVLSYVLMFLYVSVSLGNTGFAIFSLSWAILRRAVHYTLGKKASTGPIALANPRDTLTFASSTVSTYNFTILEASRSLLVNSKFLLGLVGIAIVLLSVATSVGFFSLFGVRVTLIIAEVIPFLVLAIGVDNVFILAHELERQNARAYSSIPRHANSDEYFDSSELPSIEERIAKSLGRMGPSILLSSSCQTVAFALGATVGMPAVRNFAIYAAGAVAINALLQITVFVAAMSIDSKREEVGYLVSVGRSVLY